MKWKEFRKLFECHTNQRVKAGELALSSASLRWRCLNAFEVFLNDHQVTMLQAVDESLVDTFMAWRASRSVRSSMLASDISVLRQVFAFATKKGFAEKKGGSKGHS
jgi:site-specific recombinase XerD